MSGRIGPVTGLSETLKKTLGPERHHRLRRILLPAYSRIPRIHWSQSGEDIILAGLLPEKHGTYVDVGAAHPRLGSNTYFLYRRGWQGTLVEPNPDSARTLRKARPRDRVVEAAAGSTSGTARLTIFMSDYLSSVDPLVAEGRAGAGEVIQSVIKVPVVTLADLGVKASPDQPSLLSIDCEGTDLEVLRGNDWQTFRPRVICVEESASTLRHPSEVRTLIQGYGYIPAAHTGLSAIYAYAQ